jgi:hypothetical protein
MPTVCGHLYRITVQTLSASIEGDERSAEDRQPLGSPADVHELREDWLLRRPTVTRPDT